MSSQVAVALSIIALAAAALSILLSGGTAVRIQRLGSAVPTPEGLAPGTAVPLDTLRALPVHSAEAWSKGPSLIIFASAGCAPCRELVDNLNCDLSRVGDWRMVFIESVHEGSSNGSLKTDALFPATWVTDTSGKLREGFKTRATPSSYLLHEGRVAAHRLGPNVGDLLELYESALKAGRSLVAAAADGP